MQTSTRSRKLLCMLETPVDILANHQPSFVHQLKSRRPEGARVRSLPFTIVHFHGSAGVEA